MYSDVAWVLVSLGTQVQSQIILDPDYLPYYLSYYHLITMLQHFNYIVQSCLKWKSRVKINYGLLKSLFFVWWDYDLVCQPLTQPFQISKTTTADTFLEILKIFFY